jgi:drug/metabolite transporter (DMT)-like permease
MVSAEAPIGVSSTSRKAADWLLLVAPGLIWGASFLFIAEGLEAMRPNGVTFTRILIGFVTLGLFPAARRPIAKGDLPAIALLGVLWLAFPLSMFPFAEQHVSSALTGMLNGANPLFTALVAVLLTRDRPSRGVVVGLAVGLAGTALMAVPGLSEGRSSAGGILMILAAVVSYGFALNLARPLQQRHGALPVIWRAQAVALILTAPLGAPELLAARWTPNALLAMLALGALGTAVANVLMAMAAGRVGATRASAVTFLIPGVSLALGVLVRNERVGWVPVTGAAVCVAGAWLMRQSQLGRTPSSRSSEGSTRMRRGAS